MLKRRLILMGTGGFAVPSFEAVRNDPKIEIVAVVTRPVANVSDAKASKNKQLANPVLAWAESHGFRIFSPLSINSDESIAWLQGEKADLLFVCDYGQILSRVALGTARLGGINLHGSLLPRHRGAAPVQWSILRGDEVTGVTVIHMTPKLDGGPILSQSHTKIEIGQTAEELERVLSLSGIACTHDAIEKLFSQVNDAEKESPALLQDASLVTPAPRLSKADGQIDFRYEVTLIDRQFRGLQPWPGLYGNLIDDSQRITRVIFGEVEPIVAGLRTSDAPVNAQENVLGDLLWGERAIAALGNESWNAIESAGTRVSQLLLLVCKDGFLKIGKIQPAGKRMLTSGEFLAGYGKNQRLRLETPTESPVHPLLEKMK